MLKIQDGGAIVEKLNLLHCMRDLGLFISVDLRYWRY